MPQGWRSRQSAKASAEGASHASLGQRPRNGTGQMDKGCKPALSSTMERAYSPSIPLGIA